MTKVFSIARSVTEAAQAAAVDLRLCADSSREQWMATLLGRLQLSSLDKLWADGVWAGAVVTTEPWCWIRELQGRGPYLLFFPGDTSREVFQTQTAVELACVLDAVDVAAFDFGVSRAEGDFALVKFSEGGLRGFGKVVDWLNAGKLEPVNIDGPLSLPKHSSAT